MAAMYAVLTLVFCLIGLAVLIGVPPVRHGLCNALARVRYLAWEWPLRAITGRWKPDRARIGQLEVVCRIGRGSAQECTDEALLSAGKITINQYRARRGLAEVPGPVTVDEWRNRRHPLAAATEQALASAYVQLSVDPMTGYPYAASPARKPGPPRR